MKKIIHVGLHKTGTTFLQKEVFPLIDLDIISLETFSSDPTNVANKATGRAITANALYRLCPEATILVCFREENEWVDSLYAHYIRAGSTMSRSEYNKRFDMDWLDYWGYVDELKSLFPEVLVFEYSKDANKMVADMCALLEVPVPNFKDVRHNVSYTEDDIKLAVKWNGVIKRHASKRFSARYFIKWYIRIKNWTKPKEEIQVNE